MISRILNKALRTVQQLFGMPQRTTHGFAPLIVGSGNEISNAGRFTNVKIDITGNGNTIIIGKNSRVNNTLFFIRGDNHLIQIGDNCFYGEGEIWVEDNNCILIIKNGTTVERAHLAVTEPGSKMEIGEECMLAKFVEIRTGDSHSIIDNTTGMRINRAANVTLERHVWVGAHAKILKGVTLKENCVIGTASVVTSNIPANCIATGVPAKVIREGIRWERERL